LGKKGKKSRLFWLEARGWETPAPSTTELFFLLLFFLGGTIQEGGRAGLTGVPSKSEKEEWKRWKNAHQFQGYPIRPKGGIHRRSARVGKKRKLKEKRATALNQKKSKHSGRGCPLLT